MSTTLISASAGTGKTHTICNLIADRLISGLDPARLVATTFTRKAATELAERIRTRIQEASDISSAQRDAILDRLNLAAIGTVHGVAHRFLCRHALQLGLSPRLEVLDEGEDTGTGTRHLSKLLQEQVTDCWDEFSAVCSALSLEDSDKVALDLLQAVRANAIPIPQVQLDLRTSAQRWSQVIGVADSGFVGIDKAQGMATAAIQSISTLGDSQKNTLVAIESLRTIARNGVTTWAEAARLASLAAGKRSGADGLLEELRVLGRGVRSAPGLHADLHTFSILAGAVVEHLDHAYTAYKQERGLVDFVDLECRFLDLARSQSMRTTLAAEIGCFVVDEFQDTSPIQLAIFRSLHAVAGDTIWVGDSKQAIFGFRGTDAGLVDGVWRSITATSLTLNKTYRNAPEVVRGVNSLFVPVFGAESHVESKRTDEPGMVECWPVSGNKAATMEALAGGVVALLAEQPNLRQRDIAVLVRSNHRAGAVAESLHQAGIKAIVPLPGLLHTREGAALFAGLRVVADRFDTLACAELCQVLETDPTIGTPPWFHERIAEVYASASEAPFSGVACVEAVAAIKPALLSAPDLVLAIVAALDLPGRIAGWGSPQSRASNIDALVALANTFEDGVHRNGRPATPSGLVRYFADLEANDADTIPVPEDSDAVQIFTYHKAKGLEWPVTICFDLDAPSKPRMFSPLVSGGDPANEDPLAGRTLRYWPWPFGFNNRSLKPNDYQSGLQDAALATDEGHVSQAAQHEEERRLLYVGCTRAKNRLVLVQPEKGAEWLENLGAHVDAVVGNLMRRTCEAVDSASSPAITSAWIAEPPRAESAVVFPPRYASPSMLGLPAAGKVVAEHATGAAPLNTTGKIAANILGNAIHVYLAGVRARAHLESSDRIQMAEETLQSWGAGGCISSPGIAASADFFLTWVLAQWPDGTLHTEVPVDGARSDAGFWNGIIDGMIVNPDGHVLAIIDHKSNGGLTAVAADALEHTSQLAAYQQAIGYPVQLWVHQVLAGRMVHIELES